MECIICYKKFTSYQRRPIRCIFCKCVACRKCIVDNCRIIKFYTCLFCSNTIPSIYLVYILNKQELNTYINYMAELQTRLFLNETANLDPIDQSLAKIIKQCPNCKCKIEKSSGCNEMFCTKCFTQFDWTTGEKLSNVHNPHKTDLLNSLKEFSLSSVGIPRYCIDADYVIDTDPVIVDKIYSTFIQCTLINYFLSTLGTTDKLIKTFIHQRNLNRKRIVGLYRINFRKIINYTEKKLYYDTFNKILFYIGDCNLKWIDVLPYLKTMFAHIPEVLI